MPGRAADVSAASRVAVASEGATPARERLESLMAKALEGTLTPAESLELTALLKEPELAGPLSAAQRGDVQAFVQRGALPLRSVKALTAELSKADAGELAGHFAANLALVRPLLLGPKTLNRAQRAQRLFQLAVPYVKAALAKAAGPAQLRSVASQLLAQAGKAGFRELVQKGTTGHTGLDALKALLEARSPADVHRQAQHLQFDAPGWPAQSPVKAGEPQREWGPKASGEAPQLQAPAQPLAAGPPPAARRADEAPSDLDEAERRARRGTLGGPMLWNVMHLFRADGAEGRESAKQREEAARLAVVAGLVLALLAIIVAVAVAL